MWSILRNSHSVQFGSVNMQKIKFVDKPSNTKKYIQHVDKIISPFLFLIFSPESRDGWIWMQCIVSFSSGKGAEPCRHDDYVRAWPCQHQRRVMQTVTNFTVS